MDLGAFTLSSAVKDIHRSFELYSKLGFTKKGGDIDQNRIGLENGNAILFDQYR